MTTHHRYNLTSSLPPLRPCVHIAHATWAHACTSHTQRGLIARDKSPTSLNSDVGDNHGGGDETNDDEDDDVPLLHTSSSYSSRSRPRGDGPAVSSTSGVLNPTLQGVASAFARTPRGVADPWTSGSHATTLPETSGVAAAAPGAATGENGDNDGDDSDGNSSTDGRRRRRSSAMFDKDNVRRLRYQAGRMIKTVQGETDPCEGVCVCVCVCV
jgi:hypothetical protein